MLLYRINMAPVFLLVPFLLSGMRCWSPLLLLENPGAKTE